MRIAQRRGKCRINSDNKDLYFYVKRADRFLLNLARFAWVVSVAMFNFFLASAFGLILVPTLATVLF